MAMDNSELRLAEVIEKYPDVPRFIILKLDLQLRGVKLTDRALEAVQDDKYRHSGISLYGTEADKASSKADPGPAILRDGTTVVYTPGNESEDSYVIDNVDGRFLILDGEAQIEEVDFSPRPAYYGKKTSRGVPMESVANARPQRLDITPYRYCHFWDTGHQCKYCGFFTDLREQRQVGGAQFMKVLDPEDAYETVKEALKEPGRFSQIYLTAGTDYGGPKPFDNEVGRYIEVLQAIGRNFKSRRFPSQLMAPAYSKAQLRRLHDETGLVSYCPDIEVLDERLFKWICPGKEKWFGRDYWVRGALDAVDIFGWGNVYSNIVAGVETAQPHGFKTIDEALKSNLEGCEFFARHGVQVLAVVWKPWKSSAFRGQKQPPLEYYVRLIKGFHDIKRAYGLTPDSDDYKHCGNHGDSDLARLD